MRLWEARDTVREDGDRVAVSPEIREPAADPDPRVRIVRRAIERGARGRQVRLEPGANGVGAGGEIRGLPRSDVASGDT